MKKFKRVITATPLISIMIFILFISLFYYLTNNYYIDYYKEIEFKLLDIDYNSGNIYIKADQTYCEKGKQVQLAYSEQEQIIIGEILKSEAEQVVIHIERLKEINNEQIRTSKLKIRYGQHPIGRELKLWN